jgi:hypothetical protein
MEVSRHCHFIHSWHYAFAQGYPLHISSVATIIVVIWLVGFVLIKSKLWRDSDEIVIFVYCVLEEPVH